MENVEIRSKLTEIREYALFVFLTLIGYIIK